MSKRLFVAAGAGVSLAQLLLFEERGPFIGIGIDVVILAWSYRAKGGEAPIRAVSPA